MLARDPGSMMIRRLLPWCIAGPLVLGWVRVVGVSHGAFDDRVGTWLLTSATLILLCAILIRSAQRLRGSEAERAALAVSLEHLASHDPLTGLYNRRRFEEELDSAMALAERYGHPGAGLIVDLDSFKAVNDAHGHSVGDDLLRRVADTLTAGVRRTDSVGRLGGDEFIVFLPHTCVSDANQVAEGLRARIAAVRVPAASPNRTTASIGVGVTTGQTAPVMLHSADLAMYSAKQTGGNRVSDTPLARAELIAATGV